MRKKIVITSVLFLAAGLLSWGKINDWSLRIGVQSETARDSYNFLGVAEEASVYYDAKDLLEPPPSPSGLRLYFPHEDWPVQPGKYATDFRPQILDVESYEFIIEAKEEGELILFWSVEEVPRVYEVSLLDIEEGIAVDMREKSEYIFDISAGGKKEFRVVVERKRIR